MTDVPAETPVARPLAFTAATDVVPDVQVTVAVISCEVPSEYAPVAVNDLVRPLTMPGFAGVTMMEVRTAAVTVSVALPDIEPMLP